jgi:AcrR family transcriptional regulator
MNTTLDDTQARLLDAAGQVFAEQGFKSATVREICRRAGAKNIAAVNYYFRDKEQLYRATLQHAFWCGMEQMPTPEFPPDTTAEQKLGRLIHLITHHLVELQQTWHMQLLLREFSNPSEAGAELVRDFIRPVYGIVWAILGELLPNVTEDQIHLVGFSIIGQILYHRVGREVITRLVGAEEQATYTADRLAEHITAFTLAAITGLRAGRRP